MCVVYHGHHSQNMLSTNHSRNNQHTSIEFQWEGSPYSHHKWHCHASNLSKCYAMSHITLNLHFISGLLWLSSLPRPFPCATKRRTAHEKQVSHAPLLLACSRTNQSWPQILSTNLGQKNVGHFSFQFKTVIVQFWHFELTFLHIQYCLWWEKMPYFTTFDFLLANRH